MGKSVGRMESILEEEVGKHKVCLRRDKDPFGGFLGYVWCRVSQPQH